MILTSGSKKKGMDTVAQPRLAKRHGQYQCLHHHHHHHHHQTEPKRNRSKAATTRAATTCSTVSTSTSTSTNDSRWCAHCDRPSASAASDNEGDDGGDHHLNELALSTVLYGPAIIHPPLASDCHPHRIRDRRRLRIPASKRNPLQEQRSALSPSPHPSDGFHNQKWILPFHHHYYRPVDIQHPSITITITILCSGRADAATDGRHYC